MLKCDWDLIDADKIIINYLGEIGKWVDINKTISYYYNNILYFFWEKLVGWFYRLVDIYLYILFGLGEVFVFIFQIFNLLLRERECGWL